MNIDEYIKSLHQLYILFLQITREQNKFIFRLVDNYLGDANTRHPSSVTVYDYYDPGRTVATKGK